jgi:monovalent cation:H+ antiporter-2, CPA2 family
MKYPVRVALAVSVALAQIGEFSFILATLGRNLGILTENATHALIAASMISISLNPVFFRLVDPFERWVSQRPRLWPWLNRHIPQPVLSAAASSPAGVSAAEMRYRAVIVGYGPVGRTLAHLLRKNGIEPTIIELNLETVHRIREEGIPVIYGDATHYDTLKSAGVNRAASLILSASGIRSSEEVIRMARELNPKIRILARSVFVQEKSVLHQNGADQVFSGEEEVALAMTESILYELGATPEQIDREREKIRAELFRT